MSNSDARLPSPSMLVAVIALVAALSGSALALPGKGKVNGGDIKSDSIKSRHIRADSVKSRHIRDGKIRVADVEESLRPVPGPVWAVVNADATAPGIVQGKEVVGLERLGEGSYDVRFGRDVGACSFAATPRAGNTSATAITTALNPPPGLDANEVRVSTRDNSGQPVDADFSVQVLC